MDDDQEAAMQGYSDEDSGDDDDDEEHYTSFEAEDNHEIEDSYQYDEVDSD